MCDCVAEDGPELVAFSIMANGFFSSAECDKPEMLNRRRSSSKSLLLLCTLAERPGAVTPCFNRRARMNQESFGM